MNSRTTYEWCIETIDEHGDITDADFYQHLSDANEITPSSQLCLIKDIYHDVRGLQDRQHAYITNGELPDFFDDGTKVPSRYHIELQRINSKLTIA